MIFTGLRRVLDLIAVSRGLHLDEANEFIKDPLHINNRHPFTLDHDSGDEGTSKKRKAPKDKKGTFYPKHCKQSEKYGSDNIPIPLRKLIQKQIKTNPTLRNQKNLRKICKKLVAKSIAKSTWNRYNCAYKLWLAYQTSTNSKTIDFPQHEKIAFICWCKANKSLKSQTISMYISALGKIFNLCTDTNEKFANSLLKGIKNRECQNNRKKPKTTPMDFLLLKRIKKNLKKSNKSVIDQKVLWTACVLAFWGCFRLGEIFPKSKLTFDKFSDLLGADVSVRGGNLSLNLKSTKTRGAEITKVSLSKVHLRGLCPVHAVKSLKKIQKNAGTWSEFMPIFRTENGANLSKNEFLKEINTVMAQEGKIFSGKSFRCGIPTLLAKFKNIHGVELIKAAGRWKSSAYRTYIMKNDGGISNFQKISNLLINEFFS